MSISLLNWIERNYRLLLMISLFSLLLAGGFYSIHLGNNLRFQDERDFYAIAKNLAEGKGYSIDGINPTAYRAPGYPLFLAIFAKLGAGVFFCRMLNFLFLAGTMVLIFIIGNRESGRLAGVISSLLILLYPVLFFTASTLYAQTLGTFLLISTILLLNYTDVKTKSKAVLLGAISGFLQGWLMLTIPGFIPTFFVISVWFLIARRELFLSRRIITLLVMFIIAFLLFFLWTVRNYRTFHKFILLTTNEGITLLHGNSEFATPNSGASTDIGQYLPGAEGLSEVEQNDYFRSQAIQWILNNKGRAVKLYFLKVLNWFNYRNQLAQKSEASRFRDFVMLITYLPLLLLFLIRLFLARRFRLVQVEWLLLILYVINAFTYAVFHTRIRYRLPFDVGMIAVVAVFISNLIQLFKERFGNRLKVGGI
ncbi:MAG: hypothetical protein ABIK39_03540 [candidate division WOR-3 bacterium]